MKTNMETNATVQGLLEWQAEAESTFTSHVGAGMRRRVACTCTGKFKVYDHDECIYHGDDALMAMEKYNSIRKEV